MRVERNAQGDNLRFREHRKFLSGRMSGRNRAEQLDSVGDASKPSEKPDSEKADAAAETRPEDSTTEKAQPLVPPRRGTGEADGEAPVTMEWWDEAFLAKETREQKVGLVSLPHNCGSVNPRGGIERIGRHLSLVVGASVPI